MLIEANVINDGLIAYLRRGRMMRSSEQKVLFLPPMRIMEFRSSLENENGID